MQSTKMFRAMHPLQRMQTPAFRAQFTRGLRLQATRPMLRPVPKEEHSAHTISQRLRTLKRMPAELIPLFVVVAFAVFAGCVAITRKITSDQTLRLWPEKKRKPAHPAAHGEH